MKLKSLRSRSLVTVFAVVIPVVIVYVLVAYSHVVYQFTQRLDGRMRGELRMLESAVVKSGGDFERLKEAVHLMPVNTFPRFRRLPGTKSPGTGLGLSIVQRIAELHGGSLELLDADAESGLRVVVRSPIAG